MGNWKPVKTWSDLPDTAGYEVLVTMENNHYSPMIAVTTAFIGYGDHVWYTNDTRYMQNSKTGNNRLNSAWKVTAWADKPEPYNPYLIDGRRIISKMSERIRTDRSTMEIKRDIIPLVNEMMNTKEEEE